MQQKRSILILSPNPILAASAAAQLETQDLEVTNVTHPAEAIRRLRISNFAMLIVDGSMTAMSPMIFMAKARQFLPSVLRVLYEPQPLDLDLRLLINEAAPCAIFTGSMDPVRIRQIVDREARSTSEKDIPLPFVRDRKAPKLRIPPLPKIPEQPKPDPLPAGAKPAAKAGHRATASETDREVLPKLFLDPNNPDLVAEICRILDLLFDGPEIRLPVLPQVGREVQKLVSSENTSFEQIAEKVGLDPSMSARVLEVANSPLYAAADRIRSVQHAVSRIGLGETRNILQIVAVENLFKTRDRKLATTMAMLWMHSLAVACGNEILTKSLSIPGSEDYFMMGMLHDIGKLLVIHLIQEGYRMAIWTPQIITARILDDVLQRRHTEMGSRLVKKWGYPQAFHQVVSQHNDNDHIQECDETVVVTYFANLLSRKMGLSLVDHEPRLLDRREVAQSLNMSPRTREKVEQAMAITVEKIKASFLPKG